HEVRDQPVQVLRRGRHRAHAISSLPGSSCSWPSSGGAAARASLTPCWKLVRRCLVWAADRGAGAVAVGVVTPPGTRFAFGTRLGRPARVVPEVTGACATSAACHPASAGDDQPAEAGTGATAGPGTVPDTVAVQSAPCRPRRNQSDSTDSKIGSRFSSPTIAGGGTITPDGVTAPSPFAPGAVPLAPRPPLTPRLPLAPRVPFAARLPFVPG